VTIVVFDVPASESGALAILNDFFDYVLRVDNSGYHWVFVVSTDSLDQKLAASGNRRVSVVRCPQAKEGWVRRLFFEVFEAPKLVRKYHADRILSLQNLAILRTKIPQIIYLHQSLPYVNQRFSYFRAEERFLAIYADVLRLLIGASLRIARAIIVQTTWFAEAILDKHRIEAKKISIIPPSASFRAPVESKELDRGLFFYPTTPFVYKNIDLIIDAVEHLVGNGLNPRVVVTITGFENRYSARLLRRIISHKLQSNLLFIGRVSREEVLSYYSQATLLFPSRLESFGLPLLEARLCGSLVLASRTPFALEILAGYSSAHFYGGDDSGSLADLMSAVLTGDLDREETPRAKDGSWVSVDADWGKLIALLS